jgi:hypothetical protein
MKIQVKRIVYLVLSFMLVLTSILSVLRPASASTTPLSLSSLPAGDTVNFGGYTWIVLDPSTGYLLMQGSYGSNQEFDSNNTHTFDPTDTDNIAYYLNNTFYNSLPSADQALIQSHNWTTGNESNESSGSVTCNIGLMSCSEYNSYHSHISNL